MKNTFKLLISLLFTFIMVAANAATFTIENNSSCSDKTIYQAISSKTPILISSTYTYSENGLYIENGALDKDSHKNINLKNSHGTVQIIKTTSLSKEKNFSPSTTEYFLAQNKFCTTVENNKKCYDMPSNMANSIPILCSAPNVVGGKDFAPTSGGTTPQVVSDNQLHNGPNAKDSPTAAQVTNSPTKMSQKELDEGIANGTITVGGSLMKPIYQSK